MQDKNSFVAIFFTLDYSHTPAQLFKFEKKLDSWQQYKSVDIESDAEDGSQFRACIILPEGYVLVALNECFRIFMPSLKQISTIELQDSIEGCYEIDCLSPRLDVGFLISCKTEDYFEDVTHKY